MSAIAPPIDADADLRAFPYLPLDVVRLRDSRLTATATAEEFRAAVLLWCASWHQVPASSLPSDERELAALAGYGRDLKSWRKVSEEALRGWELATDGRMYHKVVTEKAKEAWRKRLVQQDKARKRWGNADDHGGGTPAAHAAASPAAVPEDMHSSCKGEGTEQNRREKSPSTPPPSPGISPREGGETPQDPPAASGDGARARISGIRPEVIRKAVSEGDALGVIRAFGGNLARERKAEWLRDCDGMQVGVLATILWTRMALGAPIREPSGMREARAEWLAFPIGERFNRGEMFAREFSITPPKRTETGDQAAEPAA